MLRPLLPTDVSEKNPVVTLSQYSAKKARIGCGQVRELLMILNEFESGPSLSLSKFHEKEINGIHCRR